MSLHPHPSVPGRIPRPTPAPAQRPRGRSRWIFAGFAAAALLLLAVEHRAHLLGWLPWLFLLACPLMHFFMHGGHGHGAHLRRDDSAKGDPS